MARGRSCRYRQASQLRTYWAWRIPGYGKGSGMEHQVRVSFLSTAAVIAVGIATSVITSTIVAARAYQSRVRQIASAQREVTVKGSARTGATSDLGVWRVSVSGHGKSLTE